MCTGQAASRGLGHIFDKDTEPRFVNTIKIVFTNHIREMVCKHAKTHALLLTTTAKLRLLVSLVFTVLPPLRD